MDEAEVIIYTDGACKGNPGPGGYAATLQKGAHEKVLVGWEPETTNNRMELLAVISALEALKRSCHVAIYTDSRYVIDGMTQWLEGWRQRNWRKVKNVDLWQRLVAASEAHLIDWCWVKGHSGDPGNERVDALASQAADTQSSPLEEAPEAASGDSAKDE